MPTEDQRPFRVGFVTGATPDTWARIWRERRRQDPLQLLPLSEAEQEPAVRSGAVDMVLARLPVEREGLHCIPLYDERPVVVVPRDHVVAAFEEIDAADLRDEQLVLPAAGVTSDAPQLDFPPMSPAEAIEVVASGTGVVVVPESVARLYHRKDVVHRPVRDLVPTQVGLVWRQDVDSDRVQAFIGIVRGRTPRSSR